MVRTPYHQEQLTEGLLYQKYEPHIHSFTFSNMKNETIDAAFEVTQKLDQIYAEKERHIQYLYVLEQVTYSPHVLRRAIESVDSRSESLHESSAVVADTFLTKVLETVMFPKLNLHKKQALSFFSTEAEAFAWFEERRKTIGK